MNVILKRVLTFFIGLPLLIASALFFPQKNHLFFNGVVIFFSIIGTIEFQEILRRKGLLIPRLEAAILGAIGPVSMTAVSCFGMDMGLVFVFLTLGAAWLLISRIFSPADKIQDYAFRAAAGFSVLFYPGFFMAWINRLTLFPRPDIMISVYFLIVAANDAAAWASGLLLGKNNKGIIPASPNKSVAGFIGGAVAATLVGMGAALFIPQVFGSRFFPSLPAGAILGLFSGAAASLGDLAESALKRSAEMKDSGTLIPGRGGVLDCIDSMSMMAPVYYMLYYFFFG
jgi:phosphatidate cytidylyltransferase